jgi:cytochrome c-type biogenesis protein CcmE
MRRLVLALVFAAACKSSSPAPIHGWVVEGSMDVKIEDQQSITDFTIEEKGKQTRVRLVGPRPDCLKPREGVTVRGPVQDGVLEATEVKCDPPYVPPGKTGER